MFQLNGIENEMIKNNFGMNLARQILFVLYLKILNMIKLISYYSSTTEKRNNKSEIIVAKLIVLIHFSLFCLA
jgi:hypothetical protein